MEAPNDMEAVPKPTRKLKPQRSDGLPSPAPTPPMSPEVRALPDAGLQDLLVMKFGGTSIAGPEAIRRAAKIVRERLPHRPVLVLSAMGKTTNNLLAAASQAEAGGTYDLSKVRETHLDTLKELGVPVPAEVEELLKEIARIMEGISLLREISDRTRDLVVSFGERLSVRCFSAYFNKFISEPSDDLGMMGVEAKPLDSWEIGMHTTSGAGSADSAFSQVEVLPSTYEDIAKFLHPLRLRYTYLPVVTGYIAKDMKGTITTLGRDGSDLTATIIGASVDASEVQIWKDVPGIMTTDPRLVPAARPVTNITYEEASELSAFGSKVVHPSAVIPAWIKKIPMSVRNSTEPDGGFTHIVAELEGERDGRVVALSSKKAITVIGIRSTRMVGQHGFLAHVFKVFRDFEASVDVIATSEVSVSLTLDPSFKDVDLKGLIKKLEIYATVETKEKMAMLTLITGKKECTSVLRDAFSAFEELKVSVEMVSHGASNVNVTFIIPEKDLLTCTRKMHEVFFER